MGSAPLTLALATLRDRSVWRELAAVHYCAQHDDRGCSHTAPPLRIRLSARFDRHRLPTHTRFSPLQNIQAPIVFVGYGISDPAGGIDEYAGLDVRNKVVLFLRGKPERYGKQVSHADKVRTAREHGAIGLLIATGPILNAYETRRGVTGRPSAFYGLTESSESIPGAWISTSLAAAIVGRHQPDGTDRLRIFQQHINESLTPRSTAVDVAVAMRWTSTQQDGTLHNVISIVPGQDPAHQHETIVIGAHRDHFGQQGGLLFAGADDNASGTAVLLEVARVLAASPTRPQTFDRACVVQRRRTGVAGIQVLRHSPGCTAALHHRDD